jgi:hypothetical protein
MQYIFAAWVLMYLATLANKLGWRDLLMPGLFVFMATVEVVAMLEGKG